MKTSTAPLGAPSGGAIGVGLTTVVGGVGLAALLLLFYVTSQAVAPADPYYVEGPGVWLVLIGSGAELVLAAALVGISVRYSERFHRLVVAAAAIGGLTALLAAIGAYWMIVLIPVATVLVAWNLAWLRIVATWLAAAHTLAAALFLWIVASIMQVGAGSAMSPTFLLATAWPLTLAALGVVVVRNDRLPLAEPRIEPAT